MEQMTLRLVGAHMPCNGAASGPEVGSQGSEPPAR